MTGEFTALSAAGILNVYDTAHLLHVRGTSMLNACPPPHGAMAVLAPCSLQYAEYICNAAREQLGQHYVCSVSNINTHQQMVISGHREAVERATVLARQGLQNHKPIRLAKLLDVTSPFHCQLMQPATQQLEDAMKRLQWKYADTHFITNVDAQLRSFYSSSSDDNSSDQQQHHPRSVLPPLLTQQLTSPVRWYDSVITALQHQCRTFIEVGPSRVLAPLVKQTAEHHGVDDVQTHCISTVDTLEQFVQQYSK